MNEKNFTESVQKPFASQAAKQREQIESHYNDTELPDRVVRGIHNAPVRLTQEDINLAKLIIGTYCASLSSQQRQLIDNAYNYMVGVGKAEGESGFVYQTLKEKHQSLVTALETNLEKAVDLENKLVAIHNGLYARGV